MTTMAQDSVTLVTVRIDTHLDTHTAVAIDHLGRRLGEVQIATDPAGFDELEAWAQSFGEAAAFGIEGTNPFGAGLTRHLRAAGYFVLEVTRPKRKTRRDKGKSDPIDAEAAARAVLAGEAVGTPKSGTDKAEMVRVLRVARSTAVKARTQAINALRALVVTAPVDLREEFRHLGAAKLVDRAARLRPGQDETTTATTKRAMRSLARRYQLLAAQIGDLNAELERLVTAAVPTVAALFGAGTDVGQLLVTAGDNPERLGCDSAVLHAVRVIATTDGFRQNQQPPSPQPRRRSARQRRPLPNRARPHAFDPTTKAHVERRTKEGKSKREIIRCLKRYVAREVFTALKNDLARLQLPA